MTPVEKEFGPDYLRFGFNLNAVTNGPSTFNLRAAYQKTLINSLGGEWLAGVQIGNEPAVFTELYQPLDAERRFFVEPKLSFQRAPLYIYQNNKRLSEYSVDQATLDLMAGINVGLWGPVTVGWAERYRSADLQTGSPLFPTGSQRFGGFLARLDFDQFDRLYDPTRGWAAREAISTPPGAATTRPNWTCARQRVSVITYCTGGSEAPVPSPAPCRSTTPWRWAAS